MSNYYINCTMEQTIVTKVTAKLSQVFGRGAVLTFNHDLKINKHKVGDSIDCNGVWYTINAIEIIPKHLPFRTSDHFTFQLVPISST